jgi:ubiquinone/menaquinone biosynthesis C-methylase UbiE
MTEKTQRRLDYEWTSYFHGNIVQKWWKQSIANTIWEWIPYSGNILDIGCGCSPIIAHYPNAVAIDINEEKLEFIKNKIPSLQIFNMSADRINFKDNTFDNVLCIEVVEHLKNGEVFSEINRVLKNNGTAIIATPDYSKPLWYLAELFTAYKEEHINKYTKKSLDSICKENKLILEHCKYIAGCDYIGLYKKRQYVLP